MLSLCRREARTPDPDRASRLLLKALKALPERERDEVLRALIGGSIGRSPGSVELAQTPEFLPHTRMGPPGTVRVMSQADQPLPVRLPVGLHVRLRQWAGEHGFSMAAVVRGLIEHFLDEQDRTAG